MSLMIDFGVIFRPRDNEELCQVSLGPKDYKKDLKKVLKVIKSKNLNPDERQRIVSKKMRGVWWAECDDQSIIHIYLIKSGYPDYLASELIHKSKETISDIPSYYNETAEFVTKAFKSDMLEFMEHFGNPQKNDKLQKIISKVDETKQKMEKNLSKAIENNQNLNVSFF